MRRMIFASVLAALIALPLGAATPYLVKDINQNISQAGSYPRDFVTFGSLTLFTTGDGNGNRLEVWRTDGTAAGTFRLAAVPPTSIVVWNGKAWFTSNGLWSTDGSVAGTQRLTLPAASPALAPTSLMAGPSHLYFFNGTSLWRTDGTTGGTTALTAPAMYPVDWGSFSGVSWYVPVGTTLYFLGNSGTATTAELWKVSAGGTVTQVKELARQDVGNLVFAGSVLYMTVTTPSGVQLWRSDGSAAGTLPLKSAQPITLYGFPGFVASGSFVYFTGDDGTGRKLWRSNGTDAGTVAVATSLPGASATFNASLTGRFTNGTLLFAGAPLPGGSDGGLWAWDGTNTTFLADGVFHGGVAPRQALGTYSLFVKGEQLWRTDGTVAGTYSITAFFPAFTAIGARWLLPETGGKVLFGAFANPYGNELWQSDGTTGGTAMLKDIQEGTLASTPAELTPFRGGLLFTATSNLAPPTPPDLWFTDGTGNGTRKLLANPQHPGTVACGTRAFFAHATQENGREVWTTDGTVAGTTLLKDLSPGSASSFPSGFTCVDGIAYFFANTTNSAGALWRSDGTAAGTAVVKPLSSIYDPYDNYYVSAPIRVGHHLFFTTRSRLVRSDGTPGGTLKVAGSELQTIRSFRAAGNFVYYVTQDHSGQSQILWRYDGTNTVSLANGFQILPLAEFYGRLTYSWTDPSNVFRGYCTTDGTNGGTCFIPAPPTTSGATFSIKPLNGRLFYTAGDLRSTDGVSETGSDLSIDKILGTGGGFLYGHGYLNSTGPFHQVIESDGTRAGSRELLQSVNEVTSSGGRVYFGADELYALDSDVTPTGFSPAAVAAPGGQTVSIAGRGFTGPVTVNVGNVNAAIGTVTPASITFTAPAQAPGTYPIDLTLGGGRRMLLDQELTYTCSATAVATANPAAACPMTPVPLQGSGGTRCAWFPGTGLNDPSSCTPTATVAATTTYTLIVYTADGCPSTNNASVTVNVTPPPDATITVANANTDYALDAHTAFTASVPDAGPGATYFWSVTGLTIISGQYARTINFSTTCEVSAWLEVTVMAANGCTSTAKQRLAAKTPVLTGLQPTVAQPGTIITIAGTTLDCLPPMHLRGFDEAANAVYTQPVVVTASSPTRAVFRLPANAVQSTKIEEVTNPTLQPIRDVFIVRAAARDFTRDRHADVFWRNGSTGVTSVWTIDDSGTVTGVPSTSVPPAWTLATFGDFNGDTRADIFWYNAATGETSIWLMSGAMPVTAVRSTTVPVGWKPVGSVDFNGDGLSDIFWQNATTGETSIWFMNGLPVISIRAMTVPTGWSPVAFGDFNVDGKGDVFWRNPSTGETSIWLMNGTGTPVTAVRSETLAAPWAVGGSADFNGDRKSDLFWYNTATGESRIWNLDGAIIASQAAGMTMPGFVPAVVSNFDSGGAADVFWYNPTTGETALWRRDFGPGYSPPILSLLRVSDLNWKPVIVP